MKNIDRKIEEIKTLQAEPIEERTQWCPRKAIGKRKENNHGR